MKGDAAVRPLYRDADPASFPSTALGEFLMTWLLSSSQSLVDVCRTGSAKDVGSQRLGLAADVALLIEDMSGREVPVREILREADELAASPSLKPKRKRLYVRKAG